MGGDAGLGGLIAGLQRLRAQNPTAFGEIARTLDNKIEEMLAVCRTIEGRLRQGGDSETADLLGMMVLEWETTLDFPALLFPHLLDRDERAGEAPAH
jgi:hypothetical protein